MALTRLTAAHHAHGEDGVVRDLGVGVVGELAEGVQDVQTGVGHGNESQGQRHGSPQGGLAVTQLTETKMGFIFLVETTTVVKDARIEVELTRCPNVRRAISEPISSPMAMRAIPRTATP